MELDIEYSGEVRTVLVDGIGIGTYWPANLPARPHTWYVKTHLLGDPARVVDSASDAFRYLVDEATRRAR